MNVHLSMSCRVGTGDVNMSAWDLYWCHDMHLREKKIERKKMNALELSTTVVRLTLHVLLSFFC